MARRQFPSGDTQLVFEPPTGPGAPRFLPGTFVTIYTDAAATTPADILTAGGAPIVGSRLLTDATSRIPAFQGPDGGIRLYAKPDGSSLVTTLIPDPDFRISDAAATLGYDVGAPSGGDDTAAFAAALTAGASAILLRPFASYTVTGTLTLPREITLYGRGSTLTLTNPITAGGHAFNAVGVDIVQADENITNGPSRIERIDGQLAVRNGRNSTSSVLDVAGFHGQGGAPVDARVVQVHDYTDSDSVWMDKVGSGTILRLNLAHNATRRSDQPADYVGDADFLRLNKARAGDFVYETSFFIDQDAVLYWTGSGGAGTATLVQNKADDATYAFAFNLSHPHAFVASFADVLDLQNDVTKTRARLAAKSGQALGLFVTSDAVGSHVRIGAEGTNAVDIIKIGAAAAIGFLGASPSLRQAVGANSTDLATVITLCNQLRGALVTFGLVQ